MKRTKIDLRSLKSVKVLFEGDIYDLACLLLKAYNAKDQRTGFRSRPTVYGLATRYSMLTDISTDSSLPLVGPETVTHKSIFKERRPAYPIPIPQAHSWMRKCFRLLRLLLGIAQSTIGRPHQYPDVPARAAQCRGLAGDHGGDRVAGMHRISIHDPRHDFVISVDVGCGHVALGAQELHDLGSVAASEFFQLAQREQIGIADDAAPGAAEGDVDDGALPRHPGGQGAHLVQVTSGAKRMPPLPGPRAMECWTRYPVKTSRRPSSSWTGMWTVISLAEVRGTLRRPSSRLRRVAASSKRASAASQGFFSCSSDNGACQK